jgi:hypothetical protein
MAGNGPVSLPPPGAKPRSKKSTDPTVASLVEYVEEHLRRGELEAAIAVNNHLLEQVAAEEGQEVGQSSGPHHRKGGMVAPTAGTSLPASWAAARQRISDVLSKDPSQNEPVRKAFFFLPQAVFLVFIL